MAVVLAGVVLVLGQMDIRKLFHHHTPHTRCRPDNTAQPVR